MSIRSLLPYNTAFIVIAAFAYPLPCAAIQITGAEQLELYTPTKDPFSTPEPDSPGYRDITSLQDYQNAGADIFSIPVSTLMKQVNDTPAEPLNQAPLLLKTESVPLQSQQSSASQQESQHPDVLKEIVISVVESFAGSPQALEYLTEWREKLPVLKDRLAAVPISTEINNESKTAEASLDDDRELIDNHSYRQRGSQDVYADDGRTFFSVWIDRLTQPYVIAIGVLLLAGYSTFQWFREKDV